MIRLRIDGVECDLPAQESLPRFGKMYAGRPLGGAYGACDELPPALVAV